jgi:hypothetical protein
MSRSPSIGTTAHSWSSMSPTESAIRDRLPLGGDTPSPGMSSRDISSFSEGPLRLDVRTSVAVRRQAEQNQTFFYLSLFDDEIDARLEEFLASRPRTTWTESGLAAAALRLEPTDAVVVICRDRQILVARGGAGNFPLYWTAAVDSILVSTVLPMDRDRRLSRAGLMTSVAVVSVANQNEPNLSLRSPLDGWFRCRRGAVSRLSANAGCVSERPVDLAEAADAQHDRTHLVQALRSAMDRFGRRQQGHPRALVELSGGFDSTVAAIAARAYGVELLGVSEHFPYYEFRFEEDIQSAVAQSLAISRVRLDGTALLCYAPSDWWPRLDEPAIAVIRLKRAVAVARLASGEGLDRVFIGHGGDQLFREDLLARETIAYPLARNAFSRAAWPGVERTWAVMQSSPSFLRRSTLTFSHDARFDVALKEAFGTTFRSPYTDLDWVRCGLSWARLSARLGLPPNKTILAEAFALPRAVTSRRGKVPWDGASARAYTQHGDSIVTEIERVRAPLERLGLDVRWLVRRVAQLVGGQKTTSAGDDKEVIAGYALATWLRSWGVEQVSDCSWSD